jgi:sterol desaturase/sphingolipid hydroxylase (fatty acid hydroxylase superfamily)
VNDIKINTWHWRPTVPIKQNPLFSWPISLKQIFKWYVSKWLSISISTFCLFIAVVFWFFFQSPLEIYNNLNFKWMILVYVRNLGIVFLLAEGLHLYLYSFKKQKKDLKYDARELSSSKIFTFNNQVLDNMFWTLLSGVTVWTVYEIIFMWSYANGTVPSINWTANPIWFCILFIIILSWQSLHFYCIHRILHWPFLYKFVHHIHHRNINPGPWSGISMHPIEHLFYFSSVLIHFIIPSHPLHIIFHFLALSLGAMISHCGFDGILINKKNKIPLGHFSHQLHHRYFECNYGTLETPCDVLFDSYHDGTDEADIKMRERHQKTHSI